MNGRVTEVVLITNSMIGNSRPLEIAVACQHGLKLFQDLQKRTGSLRS